MKRTAWVVITVLGTPIGVLSVLAWRNEHQQLKGATPGEIRAVLPPELLESSHGGALPASKEALVPLLGAWPTDPFNGRPMIYNREKAVAYSVGENLIDDHGHFAEYVVRGADIGVSLGN